MSTPSVIHFHITQVCILNFIAKQCMHLPARQWYRRLRFLSHEVKGVATPLAPVATLVITAYLHAYYIQSARCAAQFADLSSKVYRTTLNLLVCLVERIS